MEIKFNSLTYQDEAVDAVASVFNGQTIKEPAFTISESLSNGSLFSEDGITIGNNIIVNDEKMLQNVKHTQIMNNITPNDSLYGNDYSFPFFNIDMETGTGKTFVYLKSILELNQKYGFLKFVIVVPSIAIKEGVLKTFEITKGYFEKIFKGIPYDMFLFDSNKIDRIRSFATANTIDIMVTTIQAFNKEKNVINRESDFLSGEKPIDLIAQTNPIVIIDEPQSVDNKSIAREAISNLNPSVGFRYSATHRDTSFPTIYHLGAIDAYEKELVKKIEVASVEINEDGNRSHLKLKDIKISKNGIIAKIEVYKKSKNGAQKKILNFKQGDDLFEKTKLQAYDDVGFIQDIDATPGFESVIFSGDPERITLESSNKEDEEIKRAQISKTIEEHLEKELKFKKNNQRIKVLSLFFLDKVENYRVYGENGMAQLGRYAKIFEEEYNRLINLPKYKILNDIHVPTKEVHDGYFSMDKSGKFKNTNGATKGDESTYETIMKNKEGLLTIFNKEKGNISTANKIRFIFTHSALKEGWDNPNVFQIATLIESKDTITKRQKIGRGLRLAVNENGNRVEGFFVNTLTVIANESYKMFADGLQQEYEEDGLSFGTFDKHTFSTLILSHNDLTDELNILGKQQSEKLFNELKEKGYLRKNNLATDKLRKAIKKNEIYLSDEFKSLDSKILDIAKTKVKSLEIKDANQKVEVKVTKELLSDDFIKLWDKIKHKTKYRIELDSDKLIEYAVNGNEIYEGINSIQTRRGSFLYKKGDVSLSKTGIGTSDISKDRVRYTSKDKYKLPDIITYLQGETNLTRKTIVAILKNVNNLSKFESNPLSYMNQAAKIINYFKTQLIMDGIVYQKIDEEYDQKLFTMNTLNAYLGENGNSLPVDTSKEKTIYNYIVTDSNVEKDFAEKVAIDENIRFYIKMPSWFKIDTPMGPYNPDWAILYEKDNNQHLYFVIETKGDISFEQLRPKEMGKIKAGKKHFEAIDTGVIFKEIEDENDIL